MMLNKLSLNTIGLNRIGLNRIGKPSRGSSGRPYIDPEVLASLKAVCICYGKSNDDPDRAIVKNLVDPDNPFIISNAAYKLNSGYGLYGMDFLEWKSNSGMSFTSTKLTSTKPNLSGGWLTFRNVSGLIPETKVKVSGAPREFVFIGNNNGTDDKFSVTINNGVYTIPEFTLSSASGFYINNNSGDWSNLVIEQIPSYQGAFVTDGVDDLITSTKTVQEMLGGSNEITIVSMVHQVKDTTNNVSFTNYIRGSINGYFRNIVNNYGKTGIYGYTSSDLRSLSVVNNILGDKNDYTSNGDNRDTIINGNFSVQGYSYNNSNNTGDFSSVAWYWTIIANKVLTTDEINQVIAYYNLDRTLKPDIYYNIKKQGITNDNHTEFGDKLIDYSSNGKDMQLFNISWKLDSGVGKYEEDFTSWNKRNDVLVSTNKVSTNENFSSNWIIYKTSKNYKIEPITVKVTGIPNGGIIKYMYVKNGDNKQSGFDIVKDGIYNLPASYIYIEANHTAGFHLPYAGDYTNIVIEQIPDYEGALVFNGVDDFGQFVGDLGLKDYTVAVDRAYDRIMAEQVPFIASISTNGQAPFLMEYLNEDNSVYPHSFGTTTKTTNLNIQRQISYQSTYVYNGNTISKGTSIDTGDGLTIGNSGSTGAQYAPLCLWSLLLFPYSMSEFLIERQLKKHKLGTLYPDMVEWRPIYTSNVNDYTITKATFFDETGQHDLALGNHYPIGTRFRIYVKPSGAVDEVTSIKVNGVELTYDYIDSNYGYAFNGTLSSKSPQKIDITIDEYIRYEDIVQPYPAVVKLKINERLITWGDKLKVGDEFIYDNNINLLPNMYNISATLIYNGNELHASHKAVVAKTMSFKPYTVVPLLANMPKCILSPQTLKIPNSSYRILGYIPDISGHGNHGKINNSAYAEGSGVNADGSYQLDGVDDFITIPTTVGGKQVLMKVNWQSSIGQGMLYDQRGTAFAIWNSDKYNDDETDTIPAYSARNGGNTYIDGILNKNILARQLRNITHNIVATNTMLNGSSVSPTIGCRTEHDAYFTNMSLYDFMLFDEISTDEEILTLNEYVGIEGNTDDLFTENN